MSTLDTNAIKDYLLKVGCKIEYARLIHAFRPYLCNPDPDVQKRTRTQFKESVNRLTHVSIENGMKFIILKDEFWPTVGLKWAIEACKCNYDGLLALLKKDPKLAGYKDTVNGYTAIHWAAKFGNVDIIKLIAGTHRISANIKSSAGYTPLHVAYIFNRKEAADLLLKCYKANPNIRDHSGKRPIQYWRHQPATTTITTITTK